MIKYGMKPPANAKAIFMGCGPVDSAVLKMGVFGFPEELFDQRWYPDCEEEIKRKAKSVRLYAYYSTDGSEPIGFSKGSTIKTPFLG